MYVTGILVACAVGMLLARRREIWGTTLVGPWVWVLISLLAVVAGEWFTEYRGGIGRASPIRLATAALTLCPAIALLGAKRPQEKAWHFIVGSLWLVIALPAFQRFVRGGTNELQLHSAQSWFLAILLVVGVVNLLFGRFGISALVAGCGEWILLSPFLPLSGESIRSWPARWGVWLYALSIILAGGISWIRRSREPSMTALWRDFRDAYGLAWTFRVAERLNATARTNGWSILTSWSGFCRPDGSPISEVPAEHLRAFQATLHNLLRRFVDETWIEKSGERRAESREPERVEG